VLGTTILRCWQLATKVLTKSDFGVGTTKPQNCWI